jgi:hypothetical protein
MIWIAIRSFEVLRGKDFEVVLEKRPPYCDRGNYLAKLFVRGALSREIDEADLWPRYYFDHARAKAEVEAFILKRGWHVDAAKTF